MKTKLYTFDCCHKQEGRYAELVEQKLYFIMLRVTTQSLHSKFVSTFLSPSPPRLLTCAMHFSWSSGPKSPRSLWSEGQGDSPFTGADGGGISPDVQSKVLFFMSAYILSSGFHGVLGLRLVILSEWCPWVLGIRCSLGCSENPGQPIFTCLKCTFTMLTTTVDNSLIVVCLVISSVRSCFGFN